MEVVYADCQHGVPSFPLGCVVVCTTDTIVLEIVVTIKDVSKVVF
jgi:hypothetical protein